MLPVRIREEPQEGGQALHQVLVDGVGGVHDAVLDRRHHRGAHGGGAAARLPAQLRDHAPRGEQGQVAQALGHDVAALLLPLAVLQKHGQGLQ